MIRSIFFALVFSFWAGSSVFAQATAGDRGALCYTAFSITPARAWALVKPVAVETLTRREVPRAQWPRVFQCIQGIAAALVPAVREQCLVGQDPSEIIFSALGYAAEDCIVESENPPTAVFPLLPAAKSAQSSRGILP